MRGRALLLSILLLAGMASALDQWWNSSWHFRQEISVNSSAVPRSDWPVEVDVNFTQFLLQGGDPGVFDQNSTRLLEYNPAGGVSYPVPYQFDLGEGFNSSTNAFGVLSFLLNGSNAAWSGRRFYLYFDSSTFGSKAPVSYPSDLSYFWDGEEFQVNNSLLHMVFDTLRGENTSGIYYAEGMSPSSAGILFSGGDTQRTFEYASYSNGTDNFSYDFRNNATLVHSGPVRFVVEQIGNETSWNNPSAVTGAAVLRKRYVFYSNNSFFRIEHNLTNTGAAAIIRNSTTSGALVFDAYNAFSPAVPYFEEYNYTNPGSWGWLSPATTAYSVGVLLANQTGTLNYCVYNDSTSGFAGVSLNDTSIPAGSSILMSAYLRFNDTVANPYIISDLADQLVKQPANVTQPPMEPMRIVITTTTNYSFYNRNETVRIKANLTRDPYNTSVYLNATVDRGTPGDGVDDLTLVLYDDATHGDEFAGDRVFTNNFTLNTSETAGMWNVTVRAYDSDLRKANESSYQFGMTSNYTLQSWIANPSGLVLRTVNATLQLTNYRNDTFISGATVHCVYYQSLEANVTDYGNGTYFVNFTAPPVSGPYLLVCNATRAGNLGAANATYYADDSVINTSIVSLPGAVSLTGITYLSNQSFAANATIYNNANGTAMYANISLILPSGWSANSTLAECGNVVMSTNCTRAFTITAPNGTWPGLYNVTFNATWRNPGGSLGSNDTNTTVNVSSHPVLQVVESSLSSYLKPGVSKTIGNLTIKSMGNDYLLVTNFTVLGLGDFTFAFSPFGIANATPGQTYVVAVNATAPSNQPTGGYNGTINVSSQNGGYSLVNVSLVVSGANASIAVTPAYYAVSNMTHLVNESFVIFVNASNTGNVTAFLSNFTLSFSSQNLTANASGLSCGNLSAGGVCNASFVIIIRNGTSPGSYHLNASFYWYDLEIGWHSNSTRIDVDVSANYVVNATPDAVVGNASEGENSTIGNFTLIAAGNVGLSALDYNLTGLENFTVYFVPAVPSLPAGGQQAIKVNVTVPEGFPAGLYSGMLNLSSSTGAYDIVFLNVTVPESRTWTMSQLSCTKSENPESGTVCVVGINTTGNAVTNFTIVNTSTVLFVSTNATNFSLAPQSGYVFEVDYDITGQPRLVYKTNYSVIVSQPGQPGASPENRSLAITLEPYQPPVLAVVVVPGLATQTGAVTLRVNVTDINSVGITYATANVTRPDNVSSARNMTLVDINGDIYTFEAAYPGTWGNTTLKGNYSAVITAVDGVGVRGNATASFWIFTGLSVNATTLADRYIRGSTASILFLAKDVTGNALGRVNATITVRDNSSRVAFNSSYVTGDDGLVAPLPQFTIPSDAELGNWSISSVSSYYDPQAGAVANSTTSRPFEVVSSSGGISGNFTFNGLFISVHTLDTWFLGDRLVFDVNAYDANGTPIDPGTLNLTVHDPYGADYFSIHISNFTRLSTGLYQFRHDMPANTSLGVYLGLANASKEGFVSQEVVVFRISSSLFADIDTSVVWYPQNVMKFGMTVYDSGGRPVDPDNLTLTVYDPAGNPYFSVTKPSMTRSAAGFYQYSFAMPLNSSSGMYLAKADITRYNFTSQALKAFRVSSGGPFDVRLDPLEYEVKPGDFLDFKIYFENKGEVSQDIDVEYWVSDGQRTWFYASEALFVAAGGSSTILRNAFIFNSQPAGKYTLNVRMRYDLVQPVITKNVTFTVVEAPSGGGGGTGGGGSGSGFPASLPSVSGTPAPSATPVPPIMPPRHQIRISRYPSEIATETGAIKYPNIELENPGLLELHDVRLVTSGIPDSWVEITPKSVASMGPGNRTSFLVKIAVPLNAKTGNYQVRLVAAANETTDQAEFPLMIFSSRSELVDYELGKLDSDIRQLSKDALLADSSGRDVKEVQSLIGEAGRYATLARDSLRRNNPDDALDNVRIANNFLEKARFLLENAKFRQPSQVEVIPPWLWLLLLLLAAACAYLAWRYAHAKKEKEKPTIEDVKRVVSTIRENTVAQPQPAQGAAPAQAAAAAAAAPSADAEKERIRRVLQLLDEELKQRIISKKAYAELRKRNEARLKALEK